MSETVKINQCPKCGAPIPAEAPQGLCPKCVLGGAVHPTEAGGAPTATGEIPTLARVAAAFPQLEILELIGRGGMGFVFKARQPHLDRYVALKLLPDKLAGDPHFAERFNREGRVLARLNHPNIVSVFDFGQAGGFYFLLMEFVDGVNLRQAMRAGRFSPTEALAIVPKICEALQYAHEQGVLHRDIKPENILLDAKGRVKIADFGIAKLVGEDAPPFTLTGTGHALGTPHYMAPEQLEKPAEVDHRADIFSLGVVFYEMLTGELPIGRFAPPSSRTPLDRRVDEIVMRALERERELRQRNVGELKTQVEHVTSTPPSFHAPSAEPVPLDPVANGAAVVKRPAQALLAAGVFNWVGSIAVVMILTFTPLGHQWPLSDTQLGVIFLPIFALSCLIIAGALKMMRLQAYPLAIISSVLVMVTSPGGIIGLPIGVWALITLRQQEVLAAFRQVKERSRSGGTAAPAVRLFSSTISVPVAAAVILMALCIGGAWLALDYARDRRPAPPPGAELEANAPAEPTTPWIGFTFTSVELREDAGARWLSFDYVDDVHGHCRRAFRWDTGTPGFKTESRTSESIAQPPGSPPVRHQRVEFRLPDFLSREDAQRFREQLARQRVMKSMLVRVGEEQPLFSLPLGERGTFSAWVRVIEQDALTPERVAADEGAIRAMEAQLDEMRKRRAEGIVGAEEVDQAERDLAVAKARGDALAIAKANLRHAEGELERARQLHRTGIISGSQLRRIEIQRAVAEAEAKGDKVAVAQAKLQLAEAELEGARQQHEAGLISSADVRLKEVAHLRAQAELAEAKKKSQ